MALSDLIPNLQPDQPRNPVLQSLLPNTAGGSPLPAMPSLGPLPALPQAPIQPLAGAALKPLVTSPRAQQEQNLQNRIGAFENPAAPKTGFWHRLGQISAKIGNIAGDVLDPRAMALIPGTDLHRALVHVQNVQELAGLQAQDAAARQQQSEEDLRSAQAANLASEPQRQRDQLNAQLAEHGLQIGDDGKIAPVSEENLSPALRAQIAGSTPDMATYRQLTSMGMSPTDALKEIEKDKALALAPKNMQAKTLDVPGQGQVAGKVDAQGNLLLADGTPAPKGTKLYQQPNYGMMMLPTKIATFIGPDGVPRDYLWDQETKTYDKPLGLSASNAYGHEAAQAGVVTRAGEDLIQSIEANKQLMGNPQAIIQSAILGTPWADPATAGLRAQIATFAALQPSMHGFRGQQALNEFEKIIGGIPKNPDALIASIRAIEKTAGAVNPGLNQGGEQPQAPAVGTTQEYNGKTYRFKGGDRYDQKNWEEVKK